MPPLERPRRLHWPQRLRWVYLVYLAPLGLVGWCWTERYVLPRVACRDGTPYDCPDAQLFVIIVSTWWLLCLGAARCWPQVHLGCLAVLNVIVNMSLMVAGMYVFQARSLGRNPCLTLGGRGKPDCSDWLWDHNRPYSVFAMSTSLMALHMVVLLGCCLTRVQSNEEDSP